MRCAYGLPSFFNIFENGPADRHHTTDPTTRAPHVFPRVPQEGGLVQGWESVC